MTFSSSSLVGIKYRDIKITNLCFPKQDPNYGRNDLYNPTQRPYWRDDRYDYDYQNEVIREV